MTDQSPADRPRHTIRIAARRTGLTAATLRAWERRHAAVRPARSGTERRLYSDADIERLRLLRALTTAGHSVGQLARLGTTELASLAREERVDDAMRLSRASAEPSVAATAPGLERDTDDEAAAAAVDACERAVRALDGAELHRLLMRALIQWGPLRFVSEVAAPVCRRIGTLWEQGALCVAHEHVASVAIRQALGFLLETVRSGPDTRPMLLATTPAGQRHEFGAMMAAAVAAVSGWNVTYLGPDLPSTDVLTVVRQTRARAVALSILTRDGGSQVLEELRALRDAAGPELLLIVGGAGAEAYASVLDEIGARRVDDLNALARVLDSAAAPLT